MKFLKNKAAGFYLLLVALVFAVISTIYYVSWAQANFAMNSVVVIAMVWRSTCCCSLWTATIWSSSSRRSTAWA